MSLTQDRTAEPAAHRSTPADRRAWWVVLVSAAAGLAFTTVQILEKITILKDPAAGLVCDISAAGGRESPPCWPLACGDRRGGTRGR